MKEKITIIGAGITGLSTAWKLSKNGAAPVVLEKEPWIGGMAGSFSREGQTLDFGPHFFHESNKNFSGIVRQIETLMGEKFKLINQNAGVWFKGKMFPYPLTIKTIISKMPVKDLLECSIDFFFARIKEKTSRKKNDSFDGWVKEKYGKKLYEIYFGPYTEKAWKTNPENLAAEFAEARIPLISLREMLVSQVTGKGFGGSKEHPHSPFKTKIYYAKGGIVELSEQLAAPVKKKGKIIKNAMVTEIITKNNAVESIVFVQNGKKKRIKTNFAVSTIPIQNLVGILKPKPPKVIIKTAKSLKYSALLLVYLTIKKPRLTECQWVYFPEKKYFINRFSESKNIGIEGLPEEKTIVCAEISCYENDLIWKMTDKKIFEKTIADFEKAGMAKRKDVKSYLVLRFPNAYCIWDRGYRERLGMVKGYFSGIKNLYSIGRQGSFDYYNMDQCIKEGFGTAQEISEKKKNE